jgi:hypothetical protein
MTVGVRTYPNILAHRTLPQQTVYRSKKIPHHLNGIWNEP